MRKEKGPAHSEVIMDRDRIVSRVGNSEIVQTKDKITGQFKEDAAKGD